MAQPPHKLAHHFQWLSEGSIEDLFRSVELRSPQKMIRLLADGCDLRTRVHFEPCFLVAELDMFEPGMLLSHRRHKYNVDR